MRLLGVTTKQRVGAVPDVPTIDEAGLPGYESYIWFGLFGPKGLDAAIAEKINLAVKKALDLPAVREKLVEPRQHAALRDRRAVPRHRESRPRQVGRGGEGVRRVDRLSVQAAISSVQTRKLLRVFGPNVVVMATSAASRPRASSTLPIRGTLLRGSNVCHWPPR